MNQIQHQQWILRTCRGRKFREPTISYDEYMVRRGYHYYEVPLQSVPRDGQELSVDSEQLDTLSMLDCTESISYGLDDSYWIDIPAVPEHRVVGYDNEEASVDRDLSRTLPYDGLGFDEEEEESDGSKPLEVLVDEEQGHAEESESSSSSQPSSQAQDSEEDQGETLSRLASDAITSSPKEEEVAAPTSQSGSLTQLERSPSAADDETEDANETRKKGP
ncbi:hypothetical protein BGZ94_004907 [Podila epigama]|nr:hypothetical protein BGZ94_004907 [Podila epigama]